MKYAKPKVIWLAGAGIELGTELGAALQGLCRSRSIPAMFVDEAQMGSFEESQGPGLATRLCRWVKSLAEQGYPVIVSASPRQESCLAWNRAHLPQYVEVYLDAEDSGAVPIAPDIRISVTAKNQLAQEVGVLAETVFEEVFGRGQLMPGQNRHFSIPSAGMVPAMRLG